jgi:predicted Zn-dependent peptidase
MRSAASSEVLKRWVARYFFDEVIEEYDRIPERIQAIQKDTIVEISRQLFADNIWGLGILGDCGDQFAGELCQNITPLWAKKVE